MICLHCLNLEKALEARRSEYLEASSLAYYRVSKKFAAYMNVEMERARIELEEHRSICVFNPSGALPALALLRRTQQDEFRGGHVKTAA
jgi:hypothetical protein